MSYWVVLESEIYQSYIGFGFQKYSLFHLMAVQKVVDI